MQDRPTIAELLGAVEEFLERDVVRALSGPAQYHARVGANVMRILARELDLGPAFARQEWQRLDRILGAEPMPEGEGPLREGISRRTRALCQRIRSGDADHDPWRREVFAHVRATVEEKLAIAKPEMLKF
jgi:hypothetical protein